jgi:hypothetical protein
MKKLYAHSLLLTVCLIAFATSLALRAQAPAPGNAANQDIVKLIQAGPPDSVILNKIHEEAGRWDTSVDASFSYNVVPIELPKRLSATSSL